MERTFVNDTMQRGLLSPPDSFGGGAFLKTNSLSDLESQHFPSLVYRPGFFRREGGK